MEQNTTKTKLWKYADAAEYIGCSQSNLRLAVSLGQMPCYKIGGLVRFDQELIDTFIKTKLKNA